MGLTMILLAGWWLLLTPLKNDGVSWDDFPFPIWWESHKIHVPNHQLGPKMSPVVSCCRSSGSLHVVLFEAKNSFNVNLSIWSNWQPPGLIWRHWPLFQSCLGDVGIQAADNQGKIISALPGDGTLQQAALEQKLFRCDRCWRVQTVQFLIFCDILCLWPFFGILCRTVSEKMKRKMRIQHMSPCVYLCTGHFMQKVMTDSIYIDIYIHIYIICMYWK